MLDHSTILFGSNMSNSDAQQRPAAGGDLRSRARKIKGGQHLKYPQDSRLADLLVTLFDRNKIPVEKHRRQRRHLVGDLRCDRKVRCGP